MLVRVQKRRRGERGSTVGAIPSVRTQVYFCIRTRLKAMANESHLGAAEVLESRSGWGGSPTWTAGS